MLNSTTCPNDQGLADSTAGLELRALQKMIMARCAQIERQLQQAIVSGALGTRESELQYEAFAERRAQAEDRLENDTDEPLETRAARLERILNGLECSWEYFAEDQRMTEGNDHRHWEIRVR